MGFGYNFCLAVARQSRSPASRRRPVGHRIVAAFSSHREQSSLLALVHAKLKQPKRAVLIFHWGANGIRTHDRAATERCDNPFTIAPI